MAVEDSIRLQVDIDEALDGLDKATRAAVEHLAQGLELLAETAMTLAKAQYVPVRTGFLRSTGYARNVRIDWRAGRAEAVLGFGASYARAVHETHRTKSKYLETPMLEVARDADARLSAWMRGWNGR